MDSRWEYMDISLNSCGSHDSVEACKTSSDMARSVIIADDLTRSRGMCVGLLYTLNTHVFRGRRG